jgi:hypothetical protein
MKKLLKIVGIIVVAIIVLGVISSMGKSGDQQTGSSNSGQTGAQETPKQEAMKISGQELADDFDANQVAAENKWKGKLVEFKAEITNITDSGLSFTKLGSKQFSLTQVSCRIQDKNQLLSLKNGQYATVQGVIGGQTIGVIDMSQCKVVE